MPLSRGAHRTLQALQYFFNGKAECWPRQETIARRAGCCLRSVRRHLNELRAAGIIKSRQRANRPCLYKLVVEPLATRKRSYAAYLRTEQWRVIREIVLDRDGHCCQQCRSSERLEVHHKTYAHVGQEHLHLGDLTTLCEECHDDVHQDPR